MKTLTPTSTVVQVTLACGWCARDVTNLEAIMEVGSGRMRLSESPTRFSLLNGRPVCKNCGGPLFVEDWKAVRPVDPVDESDVTPVAA